MQIIQINTPRSTASRSRIVCTRLTYLQCLEVLGDSLGDKQVLSWFHAVKRLHGWTSSDKALKPTVIVDCDDKVPCAHDRVTLKWANGVFEYYTLGEIAELLC